MLRKKIDCASLFLFSLICITLGILTITHGNIVLKYNIYLLAFIIVLTALYDFLKLIFRKENRKKLIESIIQIAVDLFFALIMVNHTDFILASVTIFFGLYILLHSFLHLFNYFLYKINKISGRLKLLIYNIVTFILAIMLILKPTDNIVYGQIIIGIYFVFLGLTKLSDFLVETIPTRFSNMIKSHIQIQLPILFAMFIPKQLISIINETLEIKQEETFTVTKTSQKPDLEVIVHLATSGSASFGHVEVCFQNKIYSYGNYDMHSRAFFDSIGDGIICIADRDSYINYILEHKDRYLVVFGIALSKEEKKEIRTRINHLIHDNTIDYHPDLELYEQGYLPPGDYHDMSSDIYKLANGKFKKILKGRNKKFFVLKTNCVMVANSILGGLGKNIVAINGIISPGSYYDYLNNEFLKKHSNVITRKVYTKKTIKRISS